MKILFASLLLALIFLCMGCWSSTGGPAYDYKLIGSVPEPAHKNRLTDCSRHLENLGFSVETNDYFETISTSAKNAGTYYWKVTGEKWKVSYKIKIQLFSKGNNLLFWEFSPIITGSRSNRQDRSFSGGDFSEIDSEVERIRAELLAILKNNT